MKAWLAFWASSMHQPMLYRLQQVSSRRLLSNLVSEFRRELPREQAQEAGYGLAALIDGLWLRAALSGKPLDKPLAHSLTRHFITQHFFDETQVSSAAMKAWLAFWASSMHQPMLYRLQQVSSRRLLSNLVSEFRRELPREQAQEAGYGLAALIDGLWLRAALSGKPLDKPLAHSLTRHFITQHLPTD